MNQIDWDNLGSITLYANKYKIVVKNVDNIHQVIDRDLHKITDQQIIDHLDIHTIDILELVGICIPELSVYRCHMLHLDKCLLPSKIYTSAYTVIINECNMIDADSVEILYSDLYEDGSHIISNQKISVNYKTCFIRRSDMKVFNYDRRINFVAINTIREDCSNYVKVDEGRWLLI